MDYQTFCDDVFKETKHYVLNRNDAKLFFDLTEYQPHYVVDNSEKTVLAVLDALVWAKGFPGINLYMTTDSEEKIIVSVKWRGQDVDGYPIGKTGKDAKSLIPLKKYKVSFAFNTKNILSFTDIEEIDSK